MSDDSATRSPTRIVSLLPSLTEIIYALGLEDRLVGVTHACDFPPEAAKKTVVTRPALDRRGLSEAQIDEAVSKKYAAGEPLYELDVQLLAELEPDLILTQGLCDVCAVSHAEVQAAVPALPSLPKVLSFSPTRLSDLLSDIKTVGDFTGSQVAARDLITRLRTRLDRIALATGGLEQPVRAFCLEWLDPPWSAGHWVPEMVGLAGAVDALATAGLPSRRVTWAEIVAYAPEVVVLLPCGYDLDQTLSEIARATWPPEWWQLPAVRQGRVWAVDGSGYFNRPGPRLFDGVGLLAAAFHPNLKVEDVPLEALRRVAFN